MSAPTLTLTIEPGVLDARSSWAECESLVVAMSRKVALRAWEEALADAQERLIDSVCGPRWAPVRGLPAPFGCPRCAMTDDVLRQGKRTRGQKPHTAAGGGGAGGVEHGQHELSLAWMRGQPPGEPMRATWVTPGGFKAFEHLWALPAAFAFHRQLGRARVAKRVHQLNTQCKDGVATMTHIRLHTPRNPQLSSGLVAFEVDSMTPDAAVARLLQRHVVASTSPYATSFVRLAPSLVNPPADVDAALAAVRSLAPG